MQHLGLTSMPKTPLLSMATLQYQGKEEQLGHSYLLLAAARKLEELTLSAANMDTIRTIGWFIN